MFITNRTKNAMFCSRLQNLYPYLVYIRCFLNLYATDLTVLVMHGNTILFFMTFFDATFLNYDRGINII